MQEYRRTLSFIIAEIWSVLCISCKFGKMRLKVLRDMRRVGKPEIFIRLQPTQTVTDQDAASDIIRPVRAGSMDRRAEKADRRPRQAFCDNRFGELFERFYALFVRARVEPGRAVHLGKTAEWPHDVQKILLAAFVSRPHILIAMREWLNFTGVDLDGLRDIELDALTGRFRSEERREGKSGDVGGRGMVKNKERRGRDTAGRGRRT